MAHGYISTTSCACWDVDSFNRCGIYASGNLDNGVFVVCGQPSVDDDDNITGYEFPVTLPAANAEHLWVINTPEVGYTFDQQLLADPREFYNKAKSGMSIKYLLPHVDCIEVNAEAFASAALPTTEGYVSVNTSGKLVAAGSAPNAGTYFSVLGFKDVAVGSDMMPVVVLQCERN